MFRIGEVIVSPGQERHIWTKHHVTPEEAEEVCYSNLWSSGGATRAMQSMARQKLGVIFSSFYFPEAKESSVLPRPGTCRM